MTFTFSELAQRFGLILRGDPSRTIEGVATLANAGPNHLGFLANPRYRRELANTAAGALVLRAEDIEHWPGDALIARDPYSAFARIAALFEPRETCIPGIHPTAVIAPDAQVDASASIGQIISPRYIAKLVNWPSVMEPLTTIQLPPPMASRLAVPMAI